MALNYWFLTDILIFIIMKEFFFIKCTASEVGYAHLYTTWHKKLWNDFDEIFRKMLTVAQGTDN